MACPVCCKPYPCAHSRTAFPGSARENESAASLDPKGAAHSLSAAEAQRRSDEDLWRREVASRVQRHRARRRQRRRSDSNASLEFDFPSDSAFALAPGGPPPQISLRDQPDGAFSALPEKPQAAALLQPKIIRFPGATGPDTLAFLDGMELEAHVLSAPRILEAPEPQQLELLPAFPDIHLDAQQEEDSPSLDLGDMPPQPAWLAQRLLSGIVDFAVVLLASSVMGAIFWKLTGDVPRSRLALPYALVVTAAFWFMLQYIFLGWGRGTPGMAVAGLKLCAFSGQPAPVSARRSRAWAATLSALSVGLGFLWALVDEDTLGWHDRISETYLRSGDRSIGRSGDLRS